MKTQSTHDQHKLTKSFRPAASLFLGAALALSGAGYSPAADSEAKATAQLFSNLATAAKTAPKVARITYTATLLSGKMRMALVSDGANVVCFVTDGNAGKSNTFSMEGNLEKGELSMVSNLLGHEQAGSRATFVGRMTATDFGGTLTLSGVRFSVTGRAAAAKSPAGLYHLYTGGLDIAVAVDEAGSGMAIAKRVKTGEVLSAKVTAPVASGALPRTNVYGSTGSLLTTVDVRRVRSPILGLLHIWSDTFNTGVKPATAVIGDGDLVGNPIRPYDIAVVPNPDNAALPAYFLYSEQAQRRIVLQIPQLSSSQDGSQLDLAFSDAWAGERPFNLAAFGDGVALFSKSDPAFVNGTRTPVLRTGQITKTQFVNGGTSLTHQWFIPERRVNCLVKNVGGTGFLWSRNEVRDANRNILTPAALVRTDGAGVSTNLSNLFDILDQMDGNPCGGVIGQIGIGAIPFYGALETQGYGCTVALGDNNATLNPLHLIDRQLQPLQTGSLSFGVLDGMDLNDFKVCDAAYMDNDAVFLLTKHRNLWISHGYPTPAADGSLPYYVEEAYGPKEFTIQLPGDEWSAEPAMWALVRVNSLGVATLYYKGSENFFATGLDVESTPEGKHVLVADNGTAGFGGRIIRVAPSEAALAAYQQRIQDNQGQ